MRPGPATSGSGPAGIGERQTPGDDVFTNLVLGAVGVLVGVGAVVHAGAFLSVQLSGGVGPFRPSLADSARAVLALPSHAGHPALAWPAEARPVLPGPVLFWLCVVMVALAAAVVVWGGWRAIRALGGSGGQLGVKSEAGFARGRDLRALIVRRPSPGRITIGRSGHRLVAAEAQASLAVIGPTGCGKTAGLAIPALLEWEGPVLAISVKGDLLAATAEHRRAAGEKVWVYDPTRCAGPHTSSWTPLAACGDWEGAIRVAAWLAEAAQPRQDTVTDGDYWYTQARKGLAPYLHAAAISDGSMRDVVRWVDTQERDEVEAALRSASVGSRAREEQLASDEATTRRQAYKDEVHQVTLAAVRDVLREHGPSYRFADEPVHAWPMDLQDQLSDRVELEINTKLAGELAAASRSTPLVAAQSLWNKDARLRDSVFATMENVLAGYADPRVADTAEGCEINLTEWLAGNNTIYVVATAHEQARLRPVLTVLVQQAIRAAYDTAASSTDGRLRHPCLILLDEAGNTAPLRDLPGYAATARSHGITLVSVWQDLAQIRAIYRDRAQTVLNNHRAKLFGTGIADEATLEYVSRLVGDERRTEQAFSGDLRGGRRSISEHTTYRRAAPVDVLRRIRPDEAVLVYGSELPAHLRLRPYYRDLELRRRAGLPDRPSLSERLRARKR
ncbi:MAG: type secretion system protein VirD4 [Cryptosporangiaceae bacterium]|nr:type secretion system protein VirD4 [Cryptosporangiaceae bacterium]